MDVPETHANIRFRMHDGNDLGPILFEKTCTVQGIKERLVTELSKEGSTEGGKEPPKTVADLKLILSGQVLDNAKALTELKLPTSHPEALVTMHLVLRPPMPPKTPGEPAEDKVDSTSLRCRCVIS